MKSRFLKWYFFRNDKNLIDISQKGHISQMSHRGYHPMTHLTYMTNELLLFHQLKLFNNILCTT